MKIQEFNSIISEDTELPDVVTARGLVGNALQNPAARQEYFDYMTHLRNKHGKEYSTRVHQKATALAKSTSKKVAEIHSDNKPMLRGLSFADLDRLSESAGDNFGKFDRALLKNLNLPTWTNTIETFGIYLRKLSEHKTGKLVEGHLSDVEQTLFDELSNRADGSIKSAAVGDSVALLHLSTLNIPSHKVVAKLNGFLIPKEIVNIKNTGAVQQLEFADGSRYPDKDGGDIFQQTQGWNMTKLFPTKDTASKAYTFYALIGKKMSNTLDFDISIDQGSETIAETIKKVDQKFELVSRSGKNLGKYPTRSAAEKREQQVNYFKHKDKIDEASNPVDTITVDVPLFIRLLEYAREDAKTDMDLHNVTEKTIALSSTGRTLSMADYNKICGSKK